MRKLMNKKLNKKGFTLMEMLIVVAIIAILVAIAIPTFTKSLNQAKIAADEANLRAYYAEQMANYLVDGTAPQKVPATGTTAADTVKVAGADYKLQYGKYTAAWDADKGVYTITYTPTTGDATTIPGLGTTTVKTTTGGGTGTP